MEFGPYAAIDKALVPPCPCKSAWALLSVAPGCCSLPPTNHLTIARGEQVGLRGRG